MKALRQNTLSELRTLSSSSALRERYELIYANSRKRIAENRLGLEQFIGTQNPGVLLMLHLGAYPQHVIKPIVDVQEAIREVEPRLFTHAPETLHIGGFLFNPSYNHDVAEKVERKETYSGAEVFRQEYYERYLLAIQRVFSEVGPFDIRFSGICASPGAGFVQGLDGGEMNSLRLRLWQSLEEEGLSFAPRQPNIVHSTIFRYVEPLQDPSRFLETIDGLRGLDLGSIEVKSLDLVREGLAYLESFQLLETFELGSG